MVVLSTVPARAGVGRIERRLDRDPERAHPTAPSTCHRFAGASIWRSAGRKNMLNVTAT